MGFQNENKLKVGVLVKATINNKVVEAKVISIGLNRVTLRTDKGQQGSYVFNSEKFLKWFNKVPLAEHMRLHAENKQDNADDLLKGIKIVTSGPSVKERTSTPKEPKESKYKLNFEFFGKDEETSSFLATASLYANTERKRRLSALFVPMVFEGQGFQASMIIIHALTCASKLKRHSDEEWYQMIKNRNADECYWDTFDDMDREDIRLFCNLIVAYADDEKGEITLNDPFAKVLPKDEKEAMFVAQLLCDGGINKYDLSCAGLTASLLEDNLGYYGLLTESDLLENEGEAQN
ncbi:hypothetical protein EC578_07195 [Helicobacter pylori]|uniref:hypothetical protein n=1 Tax=Helicobacter pylori TaxID=210 RepID=UPI000FDEA771|nr:hypothetical protein [Helicobacter pylori]RVZ67377.1 hypothetical protein EC578_07195 [Helicobacter pylori]WQW90653.1 hypothetical protein FE362_06775 [Helicobacter pylori]